MDIRKQIKFMLDNVIDKWLTSSALQGIKSDTINFFDGLNFLSEKEVEYGQEFNRTTGMSPYAEIIGYSIDTAIGFRKLVIEIKGIRNLTGDLKELIGWKSSANIKIILNLGNLEIWAFNNFRDNAPVAQIMFETEHAYYNINYIMWVMSKEEIKKHHLPKGEFTVGYGGMLDREIKEQYLNMDFGKFNDLTVDEDFIR